MPEQMTELKVVNASGKVIFHVDGKGRVLIFKDEDGKLYAAFQPALLLLYDTDHRRGTKLSININALNHSLGLYNKTGSENTILLDGKTGDILLANADCAEDFDISKDEDEIEPGTVMVLDQQGQLQKSTEAYDKKVAGVVSGAGDHRPGIVLDKKPSQNNRVPIALLGKVYCKVDADHSSVEIGDMLTTSSTAGYAMKAVDPLKSFGAVIGKALGRLTDGQGLIPILVVLQ